MIFTCADQDFLVNQLREMIAHDIDKIEELVKLEKLVSSINIK